MRSPRELTWPQRVAVGASATVGATVGWLGTLDAPYGRALASTIVVAVLCALATLVVICDAREVDPDPVHVEPHTVRQVHYDWLAEVHRDYGLGMRHPQAFYYEVRTWQG